MIFPTHKLTRFLIHVNKAFAVYLGDLFPQFDLLQNIHVLEQRNGPLKRAASNKLSNTAYLLLYRSTST